jgi:hypothetical protein
MTCSSTAFYSTSNETAELARTVDNARNSNVWQAERHSVFQNHVTEICLTSGNDSNKSEIHSEIT